MPIYSDKVMDHFAHPRNVGAIEDPDGVGEVGNPVCGDMMTFYIKVKDDHLEDVKFQTFGCGAAIAVSSMVSEMAMGKTLEEAKEITNAAVAQQLDGLPANKMHCSNLGADALQKAIEDYETKAPKEPVAATAAAAPAGGEVKGCICPYCSHETATLPICSSCGKQVEQCGAPHEEGAA